MKMRSQACKMNRAKKMHLHRQYAGEQIRSRVTFNRAEEARIDIIFEVLEIHKTRLLAVRD